MSFQSPLLPQIPRQSVVGMEGMWAKMFDPPNESPATPELMTPTNPVPEVMAAGGFQGIPSVPHTVQRRLMRNLALPAWDGKVLNFFVIADSDNPTAATGTFPAATIRVPRGVIFHGETQGAGPPPHTIHWHGIEPTPINDGVGHCSMEVGRYVYQWQPNFIGSYFYHCHRNTVQHFEFGLYGYLPIDPPDAFFASCATDPALGVPTLNGIPIGAGRDGRRRAACNLNLIKDRDGTHSISNPFPGFNGNDIAAPDTETVFPDLPSVPAALRGAPLPQWMRFQTDPHAMTAPYDVEAIWVVDDRDSRWSDLAPNARATFPAQGPTPGIDDNFSGNAGVPVLPTDFFAFNDFHADYWFVTGVSVAGARTDRVDNLGNPGTGEGTIPAGIVIPPQLMSGVTGVQVSVQAQVGQVIHLRALSASYNTAIITLPVDAVIISVDGRALGVPPFNTYTHPFLLPAGTPIRLSVARRGDALILADRPISSFATVQFIDTRCGETDPGPILMTARIPFNISPAVGTASISGSVVDSKTGEGMSSVQVNVTGPVSTIVQTDGAGNYTSSATLPDGVYTVTPSRPGVVFSPRERTVRIAGASAGEQYFRGRTP